MTPRLYCFAESGHSYKVALALTLCGIEWEPVFVDFFRGGTREPAFRALNEMGECPVLVDGERIQTQSGVILLDLARRTGRFGGAPGDQDEILRWILWDNHKLSSQIGVLRFLMNFVPEDRRPQPVIEWVGGRVKSALRVLDQHLEGRGWMVGDGPTIADLSCCSYLYFPEPSGFERADWPHVDRWLESVAALPGWKHPYELMQRAWTSTVPD